MFVELGWKSGLKIQDWLILIFRQRNYLKVESLEVHRLTKYELQTITLKQGRSKIKFYQGRSKNFAPLACLLLINRLKEPFKSVLIIILMGIELKKRGYK